MSFKIKVALVILLTGLGVVVAAGIGGYLWIEKNKDSLREEGKKMEAEAKAFGAGRASGECVAEALRRLTENPGFMKEVKTKIFLRYCLEAATQPEGYCDNVPPDSEILTSAAYVLRTCEALGRGGDQPCTRLIGAIQENCDQRRASLGAR